MNSRSPRGALLFILSTVCSPACLQGKEDIGKHTALGTEFYFRTDQDRAIEEYYSLGAEIKLSIEPAENWKFKLELDAGTDSVKVEEVWGKHRTPHTSLKLGTFENNLLLDDRISSRESLFASDNAVRTHLNLMGWYSPAATGAEFGWDQAGKVPGGYVHLFLNAAGSEFMAVTGLDYSCGGNGPAAGLTAAYYPYFIHDLWVDDSASHTRDHYFLFNAYLGDISKEKRLQYKVEVTAGTNLIDPIGYIHYPGDGEVSWFFGSDLSAGYTIQSEEFRWTPGFDVTFLIHELTAAEANRAEIRLGNRLSWHDRFYIHFDLGIRIDTRYDTDEDYDPYLVTGLGALCGNFRSGPYLIMLFSLLQIQSCGEFTGFASRVSPETGNLPDLRIYLSPEELNTLYDSVVSDRYAPCRIEREAASPLQKASIRVRGFSSRMEPKKSFTLRVEERGKVKKYALDAGGDPWFRYSLAMDAYRMAGLPSPSFTPAALFINNEYIGFYNVVPLYDKELNNVYGSPGELYKIALPDFGPLFPTEGLSEKKFPANEDFSRLNRLLINVNHMNSPAWVSWMEEHVDLVNTARYMVVRDFFGVSDTVYLNFYIYFHDRAMILPWDNDRSYTASSPGGNNQLTRRMMESPRFREIYRDLFNRLFLMPGPENITEQLRDRLEEMRVLLEPSVPSEPGSWMDRESFLSEYSFIDSFLSSRAAGILKDPYWNSFFNSPVLKERT